MTDNSRPAAGHRAHIPLSAEAQGAPPGPKSVLWKVLSAGLSGGLVVLLFAVIIPQLGSLDGVWSAMSSMSAEAVVLLVIAALVIRLLLAAAYAVIIPGLRLGKSLIAREASSAVSNTIPGPSGTATQYVILRSFGVSTEAFAGATISVGVITNVLVFAAPGIFFAIWVLLGMPAAADSDNTWAIGLGALVVSALAIGVLLAISSSERLAAVIGRLGQGCVNPFRRMLGKGQLTDWPERCIELRTGMLQDLKVHGVGLVGYITGGYLLNGLLLVWCLWACGIDRSDLPLSLGLMLYSVGRISTVVNITPGGVGVAEVAYTWVYVSVLGESSHDAVFAGVLVYRALTYGLPLLTGAVCYLIWRVMRHREKKTAELSQTGAGQPVSPGG